MRRFEPSAEMKQVIERYQDAKIRYSEACRVITNLRLLAEHPRATDAEIVKYARAKKAHRVACREYAEERALFLREIKRAEQSSRVDEEAIVLTDREAGVYARDLSMHQMQELRKQSQFQEELATGRYDAVIEEVKSRMREKENAAATAPSISTKNQFLDIKHKDADTVDSTLGDFEPL